MTVSRHQPDTVNIVIDYLERNPDFFLDNPALLSDLCIPHNPGKRVVSLIEYQVRQLREQTRHQQLLLAEQNKLISKHQQLTDKVQNLSMNILATDTAEAIYDALNMFLRKEYLCSKYLLILFRKTRPQSDYKGMKFKPSRSRLRDLFSGLINLDKTLCDSLPEEYLDLLFAEDCRQIQSTVVIPLKVSDEPALMILGSRERNVYSRGFEINLLEHLKQVLMFRLQQLI